MEKEEIIEMIEKELNYQLNARGTHFNNAEEHKKNGHIEWAEAQYKMSDEAHSVVVSLSKILNTIKIVEKSKLPF